MFTIANIDLFVFFLAIAMGLILGRLRLFGFSLGDSGVLVVALIFGMLGYSTAPILKNVGLVFFLLAIGQQAGPSFFSSLRSDGKKVILLACSVPLTSFLYIIAVRGLVGVSDEVAAGLFARAMTSTPGLLSRGGSGGADTRNLALGLRLLPRLFRVDLATERAALRSVEEQRHPRLEERHFRVTNGKIDGKSLGRLGIQSMTTAVISRVKRGETIFTPDDETVLQNRDIIRAVGSADALERLEVIIGERTDEVIPDCTDIVVLKVLVTRKEVVGTRLKDLQIRKLLSANLTRVGRGGVELSPRGNLALQLGDSLTVICRSDAQERLVSFFGNDLKSYHGLNAIPLGLTIAIGVLLGSLVLFQHGSFVFKLGLTGGILLTSIILSYLGKTGPILWQLHSRNLSTLKELGILFFLVTVGMNSGNVLLPTLRESGPTIILVGLPLVIVCFLPPLLLRRLWGIPWHSFLGAVSGGMTSTPGLGAVQSLTDSNLPGISYATVYPFALLLNILFAILIVSL